MSLPKLQKPFTANGKTLDLLLLLMSTRSKKTKANDESHPFTVTYVNMELESFTR